MKYEDLMALKMDPQSSNMRWFEFTQNNPGGSFEKPSTSVWVQAPNATLANSIVKMVIEEEGGNWYDHCPCCVDRWYELWDDEDEREDHPTCRDVKLDLSEEARIVPDPDRSVYPLWYSMSGENPPTERIPVCIVEALQQPYYVLTPDFYPDKEEKEQENATI